MATSYIEYLYTSQAQHIVARHYYRPRDPAVAGRYEDRFPRLELFTLDEVSGGLVESSEDTFCQGRHF
ncbi:hypothetical protein [Nitrosospira multiformis]|uniref:hypothetical protein n=1 Tax=Nitrosospira multiformis TaxID=1231 RepID=UPI000AF3E24F|nr:hypothetical protein [Nitrosospira multiformis]